jgi:hypothetical protein
MCDDARTGASIRPILFASLFRFSFEDVLNITNEMSDDDSAADWWENEGGRMLFVKERVWVIGRHQKIID